MDEVHKRRLVGGIVLLVVLLAVTFFFFSGGEEPAATKTADASLDGTSTYNLDVPPQAQNAITSSPETSPGTIPPASVADANGTKTTSGSSPKTQEGVEEISMAPDAGDSEAAPARQESASVPAATMSPDAKPSTHKPVPQTTAKASPSVPAKAPSKPAPKPTPRPPAVAATKTAEPVSSGAWAVQMGSFASQANATSAQKKLEGMGYRAFISKTEGQNPPLYRVRVGPYIGEAAAKASAARLHQQLKQDVKVVANP